MFVILNGVITVTDIVLLITCKVRRLIALRTYYVRVCAFVTWRTSVSETIRKPPLVKDQTAFEKKLNKIWRKTIFNMTDWILTPCNVARLWHWFRHVTAPCNVIRGYGMTCRWNCPVAAPRNVIRSSRIITLIHQLAAPCNVTGGSGMTCHWIRPYVRHIEFYIWFQFWSYNRSRHVILHQSA